MNPSLILASQSPRRRQILEALGLKFSVVFSDAPESMGSPDVAGPNARSKAVVVAASHPEAVVLGCDTIVVCAGEVLGKPRDREDAERMLRLLSGKPHEVRTGLALLWKGKERVTTTSSRILFRRLSDKEIGDYLKTPEPRDKAGSYAVQGLASLFIEKIEGSYTNVMGLPVETLLRELEALTGHRGLALDSLKENWERVRAEAAPFGARVMAVTKGQPVEKVRAIVALGATILGNNYVQEGAKLRALLPEFTGEWHFIGHIQSRKAKELHDYHCVQSLDRMKVAAGLAGYRGKVLVEVNIGREPQKSGVMPEEVESFVAGLSLKVTGLMSLPPPLQPVSERAKYFRELFRMKEKLGLEILSAGTSEDYPVALAEGANLIRLGTTLFGPRLSNEKKHL